MIKLGLPLEEIAEWLARLSDCADQPRSRPQVVARVNTRNLLRSLWFRRPRTGVLAETLRTAEARVNRFRAGTYLAPCSGVSADRSSCSTTSPRSPWPSRSPWRSAN